MFCAPPLLSPFALRDRNGCNGCTTLLPTLLLSLNLWPPTVHTSKTRGGNLVLRRQRQLQLLLLPSLTEVLIRHRAICHTTTTFVGNAQPARSETYHLWGARVSEKLTASSAAPYIWFMDSSHPAASSRHFPWRMHQGVFLLNPIALRRFPPPLSLPIPRGNWPCALWQWQDDLLLLLLLDLQSASPLLVASCTGLGGRNSYSFLSERNWGYCSAKAPILHVLKAADA